MPLYEYECQQCHRHTEKRQKFSDPEITECPHCGGKLQRVITAPAISFKGGGWYADGYGNAKPKSSGDAAGSKADAAGSKGDAAASKGEGSGSSPAAASETGKSASSDASKSPSTSDASSKPAPAAATTSSTPTKS